MTPTASIVCILAVVAGRSIQMPQGGRWKGDRRAVRCPRGTTFWATGHRPA